MAGKIVAFGSWRALGRSAIMMLIVGLAAGVAIGWYFGARHGIQKISPPPGKATAYSRLSDHELKRKTVELVAAIRGLARSYYDEDSRLRATADASSGKTDSPQERERIRQTWLADSAKLHDTFMDRYKTNYWADALLLREAMVAKVGGVPGAQNPILFQHPTNMIGIEQVANGLDLLSKALPGSEERGALSK